MRKLLRRSGKKKKTRLGAPDDMSIESAPLFGTSASRFLEYKEMRERRRERQRERERVRLATRQPFCHRNDGLPSASRARVGKSCEPFLCL